MDPTLRTILLLCCVALLLIVLVVKWLVLPLLDQYRSEKMEKGRKEIGQLLAEIEEMRCGTREATEQTLAEHWNTLASLMRKYGLTPRDFKTSWQDIKNKMVTIDANRRASLLAKSRKAAAHAGIERYTHRTRGGREAIEPIPVQVFPRPQVVVGNGGSERDGAPFDLKRTARRGATLVGLPAIHAPIPVTTRTSRTTRA